MFGSLHVFGHSKDAATNDRKAHIAPNGTINHGSADKQSGNIIAKDREAQHIASDGPASEWLDTKSKDASPMTVMYIST